MKSGGRGRISDLKPSPSWARTVDKILSGEARNLRQVLLGATPPKLVSLGLNQANMVMTAAKIARCRRDHPGVSLDTWHDLPMLLCDPVAVFPSTRRDGTIVVMLVVADADGDPVVAAIQSDNSSGLNVVLSVYGKKHGFDWAARQLAAARSDGLPVFEHKDFAASVPKPGSAEAIPSSPGPIPVDGTAKSRRHILSLRKNSTKS